MEYQLSHLLNWSKNKNINPLTGRKIKTNSNIYIKLNKYYDLMKKNTYGIYSSGPKNEDRIVFQKGKSIFAGVYDGHGGDLTSEFIRQNIIEIYSNIQTQSITERLALTYEKIEHDLFNYFKRMGSRDTSGSTACSVIITPSTIYLANTGDSRCILSENGKAMSLTIDHKPNEVTEYERIKSNNEKITYTGVYRIGGLAVSRVIGDFYIKNKQKSVIFRPDIFIAKRNEYQDFIVLATDGLYDVMTNQEIITFIHKQIKNRHDIDIIAKMLVEYAIKDKKSYDDVSVIIIIL